MLEDPLDEFVFAASLRNTGLEANVPEIRDRELVAEEGAACVSV